MERQKTRVLIAEDDPLVSRMLQGLLEETGYTVAGKAADGRQAIDMARVLRPDVILMDIEMPDIDGIEATRLVFERCPTPVVIVSAHETSELLEGASAAGVGAYLVKPPNARELERAISISIARFDDITALQRKTAELEALRLASLHLTSRLDLQEVLDVLLEQTLRLVDAHDAHIFFYDGEHPSFGAALWANGTQGQPISRPRPYGLTSTVARSKEPIVISDVNRHPLFKDWKWGGAIVGLPLRVGERVIGVMNVAFREPRVFDESELRLLELLAAQAAIAIQNAQLYQQVQQHATELEARVLERTQELTDANERLKELDRLKSKFISDISHELRTPATNVRLYLELLERGKPDKRASYLKVIKEQTDQLVRLVEEILDFSHLELDSTAIDFGPVDLNLLAEQAINAHQSRADAANLQLTFEPDMSLPPVAGAAKHITQLIHILLENAINYTPAGLVRVATHRASQPGLACLEVSDTGSGISPEDLPHIFDRFYRGQGVGSSNIPGTGLGLALAREIALLHGGRIEVDSELGSGTTFTVLLPLEERIA